MLRRSDLAACRNLLSRGSKSFNAAAYLLPRRVRDDAAVVYAYCRVADDAIDRPGASAATLECLQERLALVYAGRPLSTAVDRAFAAVVARHRIPRLFPELLLEGFQWDLENRRYQTLSQLRAYGVRVAASVGAMMTLIMGRREPQVLARACDLGVAMQLTNIARDVGEDARAGRLYLPIQALRAAGVDEQALLVAPCHCPGLGRVVAGVLAEADRLYARADAGIARLPRDCKAAIRAARLVYSEIGALVRAAACDSVSTRAATSPIRKLELLLRALWPPGRLAEDDAPPLPEATPLLSALESPPVFAPGLNPRERLTEGTSP